ncbi:MAG: hypothetical protein OEV80_17265, partial [candidate division Zixibacteria bacterium]|nr:hypothetical protein [candidate division Zixibacteria bacterium]
MRTTSILLSYLLPLLIVAAGSVGTANAGDQSYPQFVDCSPRMSGDHCDSFYFQVRAELPERDHPNNANIRYHLMSGPGEIDEHTGWWHWYTDTATFSWWHSVEIAASVGHSPMHTTPPEEYCRFMVEPQDVFSRILLDGQPHRSIFFVTAPGVHEFDIEIVDPDECDAPTVEIFRVWYPPAGSLYIENDKLIFEAAEADQGKKFQVTLHTPGGPPTPVHEFYFDTRENIPTPVFYRCSDDITMTACDEVHYAPLARFPDSVSSSGILYDLVSGPGHMVGNWHWTFEPTVADIGQTYEVEIAARYGPVVTSGDENCRFNVTVIEQPVGIHPMDFTCGEPITIPSEISSSFNMRVFAGDCSKTRVRVAEVTPSFVGTIDVVENRGSNSPNRETHRLTVLPDSLDGDQTFHLVIECISISGEYYSCEIDLVVEELQPYRIVIQTLEEVQQGEHAYVDVVLEEGNIPMGGFSFSLTHNVSALMPVGASPGPFFQQCNWADLEFHRGPIGPPQDDLPPGLFRVSGQAGHKGDTLRPTCFFPDS